MVITDMKMPGLDGLDVVRAVKRLTPDMPVVLMTGYAVGGRAEKARELACAFFRKPFDTDELKAVVKVRSLQRVTFPDSAYPVPLLLIEE